MNRPSVRKVGQPRGGATALIRSNIRAPHPQVSRGPRALRSDRTTTGKIGCRPRRRAARLALSCDSLHIPSSNDESGDQQGVPMKILAAARFGAPALLALGVAATSCGGDDGEQPEEATSALAEAHDEDGNEEDAQAIGAGVDTASEYAAASAILHHWQALGAIRDGDAADALHHVEHIAGLVSGDHRAVMLDVAATLEAGDFHNAEHAIEGMLAGTAEINLPAEFLHLQIALEAITAADVDAAVHHIEHFLATASDERALEGEAALAALQAGRTDDAKTTVKDLVLLLVQDQAATGDEHEGGHEAGAAEGHEAVVAIAPRTIAVGMQEFAFDPPEIRVKAGEPVRLVLINEGKRAPLHHGGRVPRACRSGGKHRA